MSFHIAFEQFQENLALIGGEAAAPHEPEKYNLYAGLMNLAQGLEQLQAAIEEVRRLLARR